MRRTLLGNARGVRPGAAVAAIAAAGLALTACGGSTKVAPGDEVGQAISGLGSQPGITLRLSLGITQSQAQQLNDTDSADDALPPAALKALVSGSIFVSEHTGSGEAIDSKQASTDKANSLGVGLQIGSDVPIEVRYLHQSLYARADIGNLLSDVGQPAAEAATFTSALQEADTYVPGIGALGQGKWVALSQANLKSLSGLLNQYSSSQGGGSGSATGSANTAQLGAAGSALAKDLSAALGDNATYQSLGSSNGQDEIGATVDLHAFLNQLGPAFQKDLATVPGASASSISSSLKQAETKLPPNQKVVLDVFVKGKTLTEVDLDLNQFATGKDKKSFAVPLKLAFSSTASITAPSGATHLDLSKLPQLIGGMTGQGSGI